MNFIRSILSWAHTLNGRLDGKVAARETRMAGKTIQVVKLELRGIILPALNSR
jgi:hypothetical protein